jgi:hypothetical protein
MNKISRYAVAYAMWFANLGLSIWLFYISRTVLLTVFALFYQAGDWQYTKTVNLIDRVVTVVLGLGWLIFAIITEDLYRTGVKKENLLQRFAKATGPLLLCIFTVDLIFFWVQGIGTSNWLRWLILAAELGSGIALVVYRKK